MNIPLLILGMCIVTYFPRVIPALVVDKFKFGKRFSKFINLIPYTAMTALIVPGIFGTDSEHWFVGAIGGIVAVVFSCTKKIPTAVVVLASVLSVMAVYLVI